MSGLLEQTPDELGFLLGGTIRTIRPIRATDVYDIDRLCLGIALPKLVDIDGDKCNYVDVEVWQDPEGNGPGFLALVGAKKR